MNGFLYFIPGGQEGQWDWLKAVRAGLGHAFEPDSLISSRGCIGPAGARGVLLADRCEAAGMLFNEAKQSWRKIPGRPPESLAWVGFDPENPPGPGDLVRANPLLGQFIFLGDGNRWLCPAARVWNLENDPITWSPTVAHVIDYDEEGRRTWGEVVAEDKRVWDASCVWWDARLSADVEGTTLKFEEAIDKNLAIVALKRNYRVGKAEIALLKLLDERNEIAVLNALIEWDRFIAEDQKKMLSQAENSSSGPGPPADSPAIDPPC